MFQEVIYFVYVYRRATLGPSVCIRSVQYYSHAIMRLNLIHDDINTSYRNGMPLPKCVLLVG